MTSRLDTKIGKMIDKLYLKANLLESYALISSWVDCEGRADVKYDVVNRSAEWIAGYDAAISFTKDLLVIENDE